MDLFRGVLPFARGWRWYCQHCWSPLVTQVRRCWTVEPKSSGCCVTYVTQHRSCCVTYVTQQPEFRLLCYVRNTATGTQVAELSSMSVGLVPGVLVSRIQPTSLRPIGWCDVRRRTCVARSTELRCLRQSSIPLPSEPNTRSLSHITIGAVSPTIPTPEYSSSSALADTGIGKDISAHFYSESH